MNVPEWGYIPNDEDMTAAFGMIACCIRHAEENDLTPDLEQCRNLLIEMAFECEKRLKRPPPAAKEAGK